MHFSFDADHEAFRREIRAFIAAELPADIQRRQRDIAAMSSDHADMAAWMGILDKQGWSVPHWAPEHGGTGWTSLQLFIFEEELHFADAPEFHWAATHMVGPLICAFGSDDLKARFLPGLRRGDHYWAQGFSEPGSGSDLASLKTRAELIDDQYVVNGQKIWTSGAYDAGWGFFLVRTNPGVRPQAGISFLLIDMATPGITVRQIPEINGEAHLCEVFLDNVRVPRENLLGEPDKGWTYAKFLLDHERTTSSFIYYNKRELARARQIARIETDASGRPLIEDPEFRARLARLDARISALEWSVLRVLADDTGANPTAAASSLKIVGSELQQDVTQIQADLIGARAIRFFEPGRVARASDPLWPEHIPGRTSLALISRAATIYGGSKQVQKNILSKIAFGL